MHGTGADETAPELPAPFAVAASLARVFATVGAAAFVGGAGLAVGAFDGFTDGVADVLPIASAMAAAVAAADADVAPGGRYRT